jgi:hypothetical protein
MKRKFKFNVKPNFKSTFKSLSYLIVGIVMGILISTPLSLANNPNNPIKLLVNGQEIQCLVSPQNVNGYTMVSIRDIATALGFEIGWDGERNAVVVTSKENSSNNGNSKQVNNNDKSYLPVDPDTVDSNGIDSSNKSATSVTETIITPEADNPKPPVTSSVENDVKETTWNGMKAIEKDGVVYFNAHDYYVKTSNKIYYDSNTKISTINKNGEITKISFNDENVQIYNGTTYFNSKFY